MVGRWRGYRDRDREGGSSGEGDGGEGRGDGEANWATVNVCMAPLHRVVSWINVYGVRFCARHARLCG